MKNNLSVVPTSTYDAECIIRNNYLDFERLALNLIKNKIPNCDKEDFIHDCYCEILKYINTFNSKLGNALSTWCSTIIIHHMSSVYFPKLKNNHVINLDKKVSYSDDYLNRLIIEDTNNDINKLLAGWNQTQRKIIELYRGGQSATHISEEFDVSKAYVYQTIKNFVEAVEKSGLAHYN